MSRSGQTGTPVGKRPGEVLRLGTRASPLAVRQAEWVAARLREVEPGLGVELRRIRTTGDRVTGRPLAEIGGKGLFVKEIEEALLAGEVDAGVHSMKDLPAVLPAGLGIVAVPVREDPRDVLVGRFGGGVAGLPSGARVGTGSLRRRALLRQARRDVEVIELRGNVETRLGKWRSGEIDAVVLAAAGLRRLGIVLPEAEALSPRSFVPAIGQGALAIEASAESGWTNLLRRLDDPAAAVTTAAERAFLAAVGGDCKTPIAAHAELRDGSLALSAMIAAPDGSRLVSGERSGSAAAAEDLGRSLGAELLERGGAAILAELAR